MLATFSGGGISLADYQHVVAGKVLPVRILLADEEPRRKALLEEMVDYELLVREAERRGYAEHPKVKVAVRIAEAEALVEGPLATAPESIPETEVEAAYAQRAGAFKRDEERRACHAVLASEADALALIAQARKAGSRAHEVVGRAARERSLDAATKGQSGELGFFTASGDRRGLPGEKLAPELVAAVYALRKNGDVAPKPIATQGGFSVIVLVDRVPAEITPKAQAKAALREALAAERSTHAVSALLEELKRAIPTETYPERADAIALDAPPSRDIPTGFSAAPPDPTAPPVIQEPDGF